MNAETLESLLRLAQRKMERGRVIGDRLLVAEGANDRQRLLLEAARTERPEDAPECYSPGRIKTPVEIAENCCESCPFVVPCHAGPGEAGQ